MKKKIYLFLTISFILMTLLSCQRKNVVALVNEKELFSLKYGSFEDELNLFNLSGTGAINTYMTMLDGFFYIANGELKKIMELNSYGDLLSLYYNEEITKTPSFTNKDTENSTKKAISYPFNTLGPIAVDSRKYLYAVDSLPFERQEYDEDNRLLLRHVVLRFKSDGTFLDYIGQQGPGGTPFPFIKNIYTTKNNEFVVICNTNNGSIVYWFNANGFLLYKIPIDENSVPKFESENDSELSTYVSVENIIPDNIYHKVYLKVDYFQNYLDSATKVQSGIDYEKTLLYPLDIETGLYEEPLDIPAYEDSVSENLSKELYSIPFDFLGVTDSGWFFFSLPIENGYLIQMVQPNGQRILKRALPINHNDILYYSLNLSGNGIISGLFVQKDKADVTWWRTDSLVGGFVN